MTQKHEQLIAETASIAAIDHTWGNLWREEGTLSGNFFNHRVFLESYPLYCKYLGHPVPGSRFLEVGTGSGRHGLKFALDNPQMKVVMTDLLPVSAEKVKEKIAQLHLQNAEVEVCDARVLAYPDASFDVVFSDAVIQYFPDYAVAVKEMERVLKPGGMLILSVINWWNLPHLLDKKMLGVNYPWGYEKSFTKKELRSIVEDAGLRITHEDGFAAAYGIYRLKYRHDAFKIIGRIAGRGIKMLDPYLGGVISKYFGFQIVVIATKHNEHG